MSVGGVVNTQHKRARIRLEADAPAASSGAWIIAAGVFAFSGAIAGAGIACLVWWLT